MSAPETIFEPFTWLPNMEVTKSDHLLMQSRDVSAGVAVILELLERDQLSRGNHETPILSAFDTGNLLRLTISSLHLIAEATDLHIERLNDERLKEVSK